MAPIRAEVREIAEARRSPAVRSLECPPSLVGAKVLVVDDEQETRDFLRFVLEDCRMEVSTAGSVEEALAALDERRVDVVVSDIGMPDRDGYELARALRSHPSLADTPAIALTAYARVEDRTRALREGFDAHLAKPVEPAELLAVLASTLRARRR